MTQIYNIFTKPLPKLHFIHLKNNFKNFQKQTAIPQKRLYLRLFDVIPGDIDGGNGFDFEVIPNATIAFRDSLPENVEIVPVVYITIEALRLMQHSANDYARLITDRILGIADFHEFGNLKERLKSSSWPNYATES